MPRMVIDADGHVLEEDALAGLIEERYRSQAVKRAGNGHFLFAGDFPHENGPGDMQNEIAEVGEIDGLRERDKAAILPDSAKKFSGFDTGS